MLKAAIKSISNCHTQTLKHCTRFIKNQSILPYAGLTIQCRYPIVDKKRIKRKYDNLVKQLEQNPYYRLMRWHQPIGALLLYWPTAWGVCIGSSAIASPYLLLLFLMGSWTARSAGCIVNDYLDRDFDKKVQRTKSRPLASGEISVKEAAQLLFINLCGGFCVLLHMNIPTVITTFGFVALGGLYPLAKRYTNYPQLVLGMCFNSGVIIACMTANEGQLPPAAVVPIYISGILWTLVYDTVYAYQDISDDLRIGVKSTAVTWKDKNPKLIMQQLVYAISLCHLILPMLDADYGVALPFMLAADVYLVKSIRQIDLANRNQCRDFFMKNGLYGAVVFLGLFLMSIVKTSRRYQDETVQRNSIKK